MNKVIVVLKNKLVQIALSAFFGVLFTASSYTPAYTPPRGRASAAQIDPFMLALGIALLVLAFLVYRKWIIELKSE
jgi:hypothetical protein